MLVMYAVRFSLEANSLEQRRPTVLAERARSPAPPLAQGHLSHGELQPALRGAAVPAVAATLARASLLGVLLLALVPRASGLDELGRTEVPLRPPPSALKHSQAATGQAGLGLDSCLSPSVLLLTLTCLR